MSLKISHVVRINTNEPSRCEHCDFKIDSHNFAESINHYLEQHGYSVLHIGTESVMTDRDEPYHTSVAMLGK